MNMGTTVRFGPSPGHTGQGSSGSGRRGAGRARRGRRIASRRGAAAHRASRPQLVVAGHPDRLGELRPGRLKQGQKLAGLADVAAGSASRPGATRSCPAHRDLPRRQDGGRRWPELHVRSVGPSTSTETPAWGFASAVPRATCLQCRNPHQASGRGVRGTPSRATQRPPKRSAAGTRSRVPRRDRPVRDRLDVHPGGSAAPVVPMGLLQYRIVISGHEAVHGALLASLAERSARGVRPSARWGELRLVPSATPRASPSADDRHPIRMATSTARSSSTTRLRVCRLDAGHLHRDCNQGRSEGHRRSPDLEEAA